MKCTNIKIKYQNLHETTLKYDETKAEMTNSRINENDTRILCDTATTNKKNIYKPCMGFF